MPDNIIAFAAHHAVIDIHYHHCYQVVVSITNKFNCSIGGKEYADMNGFIINQGIKHSCAAPDTSVLVLLIDAESHDGWQLKTILAGEVFLRIESVFTQQQLLSLQVDNAQLQDVELLFEKYLFLCKLLFPSGLISSTVETDSRMPLILNYIETHIEEKIELDDIARLVFLSPERARHLFVLHTGIPFSRYLLWKRIKNVLYDVLKNNTAFKNAASKNGFTDQAHFSKIFKRMFGVSAKPFLKNSRFIQFLSPCV